MPALPRYVAMFTVVARRFTILRFAASHAHAARLRSGAAPDASSERAMAIVRSC